MFQYPQSYGLSPFLLGGHFTPFRHRSFARSSPALPVGLPVAVLGARFFLAGGGSLECLLRQVVVLDMRS